MGDHSPSDATSRRHHDHGGDRQRERLGRTAVRHHGVPDFAAGDDLMAATFGLGGHARRKGGLERWDFETPVPFPLDGGARKSKVKQRLKPVLVKPHDHFLAVVPSDQSGRCSSRAQLDNLVEPLVILGDVTGLKRNALLRQPRHLATAKGSSRLVVHNNLLHHKVSASVYSITV